MSDNSSTVTAQDLRDACHALIGLVGDCESIILHAKSGSDDRLRKCWEELHTLEQRVNEVQPNVSRCIDVIPPQKYSEFSSVGSETMHAAVLQCALILVGSLSVKRKIAVRNVSQMTVPIVGEPRINLSIEMKKAMRAIGAERPVESGRHLIDPANPNSDAHHSTDFRSVRWFGVDYTFTAKQAIVVKLLYENWKSETPEVGNETLLQAVDHEAPPRG